MKHRRVNLVRIFFVNLRNHWKIGGGLPLNFSRVVFSFNHKHLIGISRTSGSRMLRA